jgi:protoheme IX farnesyltransferase
MGSLRDYIALAKPRITFMVLLTAGLGLYMAPSPAGFVDNSDGWSLRNLGLLGGTAGIVAAANALNMYLERDIDGLAARTRRRPLPAGRLAPSAALYFGLLLGLISLPLLWAATNLLTAALGLAAFLLYVAVYTPMKQLSPGALVVGSVPGAIPPLMGYTAVTGRLDLGGLTLFSIMFLWQLPHFLAISLYRLTEYRQAGYKVTATEHGIGTVKLQIILYLLALCPVTLLLVPLGLAGKLYLWTALLSGILFLGYGLLGLRPSAGARWARKLFSGSLLYLLTLAAALIIGKAVG